MFHALFFHFVAFPNATDKYPYWLPFTIFQLQTGQLYCDIFIKKFENIQSWNFALKYKPSFFLKKKVNHCELVKTEVSLLEIYPKNTKNK